MKAAVYGATRNVYGDLIAPIKSLMLNSDVDQIYVLTEDDSIDPFKLPKEVKFINVSDQKFFKPDGANYSQRWTWMTLMRIALCHIFPQMDKIVWFDNDTIVQKDISDLWDIDLGDCYVAGVKEPQQSRRNLYINAGVLVFNLELLREGKADEMIRVLNRQKLAYPDQDVINCLCQGYIKEIPSIYNVYDQTTSTDDQRVIHLAGKWNFSSDPIVKKYREIPWIAVEKKRRKSEM